MVAIYSTFLQRAYDQLIHDVALQDLDVLFAIDRAGLVGPDGPTHAGAYDLSYLRALPNMVLMAPSDEDECRRMLTTGWRHAGPAAVRYPRGLGPGSEIHEGLEELEIGKGRWCRHGDKLVILSFGSLLEEALAAAEHLNASVIDMRFIKPLDGDLIEQAVAQHDYLLTLEDNALMGGAGSAVGEYLAAEGLEIRQRHLGLDDEVIEHGSRQQLLREAGLDRAGIIRQVEQWLATSQAPYPKTKPY